jgi:hypothetical protein
VTFSDLFTHNQEDRTMHGFDDFQLSDDDGQNWRAATKAEYVAAERAAGFNNTLGQPDEPATSAFGGLNGKRGRSYPLTKPGVEIRTFAEVELF